MLQLWIFFLTIIFSFHFISASVQCEQKNVTVQLSSNISVIASIRYTIATWFCWKQNIPLDAKQVVHLTISGFTYDHTYWRFPHQSPNYSYVDYIIENSNGSIVVLNIDRIGVGLSDKPLGAHITIGSEANIIYQLTKKLSKGVFQNISFTNIILVGHSLGTIIALTAASNSIHNAYIKGLIATGFLHLPNLIRLTLSSALSYPAYKDPKFSQQSIPRDYLTTRPDHNTRQFLFYNANDADPDVIELDEQLKQTGTASELLTAIFTFLPMETLHIPKSIPLLIVLGELDLMYCNLLNVTLSCKDSMTIQQREALYYRSPIETYVLKQSGHCINLHLNAQDWYQQAFNWTHRYFGVGTDSI